MAAHQAGWLNATIDHGEKAGTRKPESRAMQCRAAKTPAPFIHVDEGGYFIEMLGEAGPVKSSPMGGFEALDWVDIHAYIALAIGEVEGWEATLLRKMSRAYALGLSEGANPFSIPPADREATGPFQ